MYVHLGSAMYMSATRNTRYHALRPWMENTDATQSKRSLTGVLYQLPGHWNGCYVVADAVKHYRPPIIELSLLAVRAHQQPCGLIRDCAAWSFRFV
jgi:hypothetical protein